MNPMGICEGEETIRPLIHPKENGSRRGVSRLDRDDEASGSNCNETRTPYHV